MGEVGRETGEGSEDDNGRSSTLTTRGAVVTNYHFIYVISAG